MIIKKLLVLIPFSFSVLFTFAQGNKKKEKEKEVDKTEAVSQQENISELELNSILLQKFAGEVTQFSSLEEALKSPEHVIKLDLSKQNLTSVPSGISKLPNLQELNLSGNQLERLNNDISSLNNLQVLDLSGNKFTSVPNEVCSLKKLKALYLNGNQIKSLGDEISCLKNLEKLFVQNNQLNTLSADIGKLTGLKTLYLHNNDLTKLPEKIADLKMLQVLFVQNNKLSDYPYFTEKLDYLNYFQFEPQNSTELLKEQLRQEVIRNSYQANNNGFISGSSVAHSNLTENNDQMEPLSGIQYQNVVYPPGFKQFSYLRTGLQIYLWPIFLTHYIISANFRVKVRYTIVYRTEQRIIKELQASNPNVKKINRLNRRILRMIKQ